jgi:hypothetical protein
MSLAAKVVHAKGEKIGRWVLEEPVGVGGFSEVWRASPALDLPPEWLQMQPPVITAEPEVAIKILVHAELVATLEKEKNALALIRGEGIVRTIDANLDHDPPYLVLAYLAGGDLRARLRKEGGKLHPSEALRTVERILEILSRVHKEGVVHGDLKPENVLFSRRGELHLADFGLSRRISQRSATLSVSLSLADARLAGTLEYMAPEQRDGEKPTARSDVYAVGVILHELLTGERPQGLMELPGRRDVTLPPLVDRTLAGALALDPRERFEDAGAMLKFLRVGLWNDGNALRTTGDGLRDRQVVAAHFEKAWAMATLFLVGISLADMTRDLAGFLAFGTALLVTLAPLLVLLPWLGRWNARLLRAQARVEGQLAVLRGWREPDTVKAVTAWAPELVATRPRRGALDRAFRLIRIGLRRFARRFSRRRPAPR